MTWRLNSGLNDLCFLMTRPFLPPPGAGDPVCYSNTSVQSMGCSANKNKLSLNRFFANSLKIAKIIGYLTDACQILLLFAEMKTNTKAKAKRVMKASYTQLSFDL
jgi:hypothetical protein